MKKFFLLTNIFILLTSIGFAQLKVKNLLCENRGNPSGLDVPFPRFSWQLSSGTRNLTAPSTPGTYEFRYLLNNGYTSVVTSSAVTVQ